MLYTKAKKAISIIIIQVDYRAVPYNGGFIVGASHPTKPCLLGVFSHELGFRTSFSL
jgi:hypothetical protein